MPSKIIFIHVQTSKIQLFDIQIMKNFEVSFWQKIFFVLILEESYWYRHAGCVGLCKSLAEWWFQDISAVKFIAKSIWIMPDLLNELF